jgi:hypothetical protein
MIGVGAGLFFTLMMLGFGREFYFSLGGRGGVLEQSIQYSQVLFSGAISIWLVNTLASVLRGTGDMRLPSATLIATAIVQIAVGGAFGFLGVGACLYFAAQGAARVGGPVLAGTGRLLLVGIGGWWRRVRRPGPCLRSSAPRWWYTGSARCWRSRSQTGANSPSGFGIAQIRFVVIQACFSRMIHGLQIRIFGRNVDRVAGRIARTRADCRRSVRPLADAGRRCQGARQQMQRGDLRRRGLAARADRSRHRQTSGR